MHYRLLTIALLLIPICSYGAVEDFTTYTETDPTASMTVTATRATLSGANDNNIYNLYKDYGASYFDSLDVDFTLQLNTGNTSDALLGVAFVNSASPGTENLTTFATTDVSTIIYFSTNYRIYLYRGAQVVGDNYTGLSVSTPYYCTMTRTAGSDTITTSIYSDSARTSLIDTLSVSGFGTVTWQYVYGLMNAEYNENNTVNGFTENLDLNIAVSTPATTRVIIFD